MRNVLTIAIICTVHVCQSQSLKVANKLFDRYEYAAAASEFEAVHTENRLGRQDLKRYGYALYMSGDYDKCQPVSDSILAGSNTDPFFYFLNGEVSMNSGEYEKAISSFKKYQELDDEFDVSMKIQTCELIEMWEPQEHVYNKSLATNGGMADVSGANYGEYEIEYTEMGFDSAHVMMQKAQSAELLNIHPILRKGEELRSLEFIEGPKSASIPSIAFDPASKEVFITIMQPMAKLPMDKAAHLYIGEISDDFKISNIRPWMYSGYEDSTSCGYASFNASGDVLVFTKIGKKTNGADLYFSERKNQKWSTPVPYETLNTSSDDMYPIFHGDSMLTFASEGRAGYGKLDVYYAKFSGDEVMEVIHPKAPVNSSMDDFNFVFYTQDSARYTSNRSGGAGDDDIYRVKFKETEVIIPVEGPSEFDLFVDNWEDERIYFEFSQFHIEEDMDHLQETIKFLQKYSKSTLIVTGHADSRGGKKYNKELAEKRASRVRKALVDLGIPEGQIQIISLGKSAPPIDCEDCTEKEHSLNRVAIVSLDAKE